MKRFMMTCVVTAVLVPVGPAVAGGGGCREATATTARTTEVGIKAFCFEPTIVRIRPGETVTWVNNDSFVDHTVTAGIGTWGRESLTHGQSLKHTFTEPGLYPFYCRYHMAMGGVVEVAGRDLTEAQPAAARAPIERSSFPVPVGIGLLLGGAVFGFTAGRRART